MLNQSHKELDQRSEVQIHHPNKPAWRAELSLYAPSLCWKHLKFVIMIIIFSRFLIFIIICCYYYYVIHQDLLVKTAGWLATVGW